MNVTYMTAVADRREFRLARLQAAMTGYEVSVAAGYCRNACGNFENAERPLSEREELMLLDFLQVLVERDANARDYKSATEAFCEAHKLSYGCFAARCGVSKTLVSNIVRGKVKKLHVDTRKKLDAILFSN